MNTFYINKILRNRESLSINHYVRKADPESEYWFDFAKSKIEIYKKKFDDEFCLVIAGSNDLPDDFYAIPYRTVKFILVDKNLSNDEKGRVRWIGRIENHILKISNSGKGINIRNHYKNWKNIGLDEITNINGNIVKELNRRKHLLRNLIKIGGPKSVSPKILRELKLYGGAQGIWVDKFHTLDSDPNGIGLTVSVLHKGEIYEDDLEEDGLLYHYPSTNRPKARDYNEISATKNLKNYDLPLFVILVSEDDPKLRDVRVGWVEDWDDKSEIFLIRFDDIERPTAMEEKEDRSTFKLTDNKIPTKSSRTTRSGQYLFNFKTMKRYGAECAVCGTNIVEILDAAHLYPKRLGGSDDPRNGLVLCASHHRAFDRGLFRIRPDNYLLIFKPNGPSKKELKIKFPSIAHLVNKPHSDALKWVYKQLI